MLACWECGAKAERLPDTLNGKTYHVETKGSLLAHTIIQEGHIGCPRCGCVVTRTGDDKRPGRVTWSTYRTDVDVCLHLTGFKEELNNPAAPIRCLSCSDATPRPYADVIYIPRREGVDQ